MIGRERLVTAVVLAAPTLAASLFVGLFVSVLQAITSIQEQTLNFAPRILAVCGILIVTLPWAIKILVGFTTRMVMLAAEAGG